MNIIFNVRLVLVIYRVSSEQIQLNIFHLFFSPPNPDVLGFEYPV